MASPVTPMLTLTGVLGDSDRPGFRRLSFSHDLGYYAEFRAEDVAHTAAVAAGEQSFLGDQATCVTLRSGATVEYAWRRAADLLDEFDLDARLGGRSIRAADRLALTPHTECDFATCGGQGTCNTCETACGQATCDTCGQATCNTCDTCQTACGQDTCDTCHTNCGQNTCGQDTCQDTCTCFPCIDTDACTQGNTCFSPTECVPEQCFVGPE